MLASGSLLYCGILCIFLARYVSGVRMISEFGGLAKIMPVYAVLFAVAIMSSIGLPGLNGFIGEFVILQGAWQVNKMWAVFSVFGIVLAAAYLLWLYQRVMFGEVTHEENKNLPDLNLRELVTLVPLVLWAFWIGIYPKPYFDVMQKPVAAIVQRIEKQPTTVADTVPMPAPEQALPQNAEEQSTR